MKKCKIRSQEAGKGVT